MKGLAIIAALMLGFIPSASAKAPPDGFRVCGDVSCVAITGMDAEILAINIFYGAGSTLAAAPAPAPFYALHWVSAKNGTEQTAYYIPSASAILASASRTPPVSPGWLTLSSDAETRLSRLTAGLEPFAAQMPTRVVVGGKAVHDPASYAVLWTVGWRSYAWSSGWLSVRIHTALPSPWQGSLLVAMHRSLIERDGDVYAVPARLAARIRSRVSLR